MAIQRTQGFSSNPASSRINKSNASAQVHMGASSDSVTLTQNASQNPKKGLLGIPGVQPGDSSHVSSSIDFDDIKDFISNHLKAILLVSAIAAGGVVLFVVTHRLTTAKEMAKAGQEEVVENTAKTLDKNKPSEQNYYSNNISYGSGGSYGSGYWSSLGSNTPISPRDRDLAGKAERALKSTWRTNQPPRYYEMNQVIQAFKDHGILEHDYLRAIAALYHDYANRTGIDLTDAKKRLANAAENEACRKLGFRVMDKSIYDYGQELIGGFKFPGGNKRISNRMRNSLRALDPSQDIQNRLNAIKNELPSSALKDEYEKAARILRDIQNPPKRSKRSIQWQFFRRRKPSARRFSARA